MKTISICCQKGGVGKTTSAAALASLFAGIGKVLLLDADQQCNLTDTMTTAQPKHTILEWLQRNISLPDAVLPLDNIDLLPGSNQIADNAIRQIQDVTALLSTAPYNYCIIDCPPALGRISLAMMAAADIVIVPTTADLLGYTAYTRTIESLQYIKNLYHGNQKVITLLTRYNARAVIDRDFRAAFEQTGTPVYTVRNSIAVKESQAMRKSVIDYAPRSTAAQDYKNIFEELKGI